ncbi:HGPRTase-like protein 2 [Gossypium arboreum]|uniref:HGPRTase-like protein 2 n=1 Tax=Gossypium arboreum TaxID=29729 RepID=A0A0B0NV36_GOSAR|nr:HGPRTase-like protein 2 [Gossypium arboreum]
MGERTKSTRPGIPHTGSPHGRVNLVESKHDSHGYNTHPFHSNRLEHGLKILIQDKLLFRGGIDHV